jgi:hypothetical protein
MACVGCDPFAVARDEHERPFTIPRGTCASRASAAIVFSSIGTLRAESYETDQPATRRATMPIRTENARAVVRQRAPLHPLVSRMRPCNPRNCCVWPRPSQRRPSRWEYPLRNLEPGGRRLMANRVYPNVVRCRRSPLAMSTSFQQYIQ